MSETLKTSLNEAEAKVTDAEQSLALLGRLIQEKQPELKARIMDYAVANKAASFKPEELEAFLKRVTLLDPKIVRCRLWASLTKQRKGRSY